MGVADWVIDGRTACIEEALNRIAELFNQRDAIKRALWDRAATAQNELREVFARLTGVGGQQFSSSEARTTIVE